MHPYRYILLLPPLEPQDSDLLVTPPRPTQQILSIFSFIYYFLLFFHCEALFHNRENLFHSFLNRGKNSLNFRAFERKELIMKILKQKEVVHMTGLSRVTIWRLEQRGEFPEKIALSPNRVGWLENEVSDWVTSRPRISSQQEVA